MRCPDVPATWWSDGLAKCWVFEGQSERSGKPSRTRHARGSWCVGRVVVVGSCRCGSSSCRHVVASVVVFFERDSASSARLLRPENSRMTEW